MWWSRVGPLAAALRVVPPNHRLQATAGGMCALNSSGVCARRA
jgi:hypothetical protein